MWSWLVNHFMQTTLTMLLIGTSCTYFMQTILQHWMLRLQCPQTVTVVRLPPNPVNRGQDILSSDAIFDFHTSTDTLKISYISSCTSCWPWPPGKVPLYSNCCRWLSHLAHCMVSTPNWACRQCGSCNRLGHGLGEGPVGRLLYETVTMYESRNVN